MEVIALEQRLKVNRAAEAMAPMQSAGKRGAMPHTGKRPQRANSVGAGFGFAASVLSVPSTAVATLMFFRLIDQDKCDARPLTNRRWSPIPTEASECIVDESDTSRPRSKRRGAAKLTASLTACGRGHGATRCLFHFTCRITLLPGDTIPSRRARGQTAAPLWSEPIVGNSARAADSLSALSRHPKAGQWLLRIH